MQCNVRDGGDSALIFFVYCLTDVLMDSGMMNSAPGDAELDQVGLPRQGLCLQSFKNILCEMMQYCSTLKLL